MFCCQRNVAFEREASNRPSLPWCVLYCVTDGWALHCGATGEVTRDAREVGSTGASRELGSEGDCHDLLEGL